MAGESATASLLTQEQLEEMTELKESYSREAPLGRPPGASVAPRVPRPMHLRVIRLHAAGFTNFEIAELTGYSSAYVSKLINLEEYAELKTQLADEVAMLALTEARDVIQAHTREAAENLVDLMRNSESEGIRFRATESVLDRGGVPKAAMTHATSLRLDSEDLSSIRQALDDMQQPDEELVEVQESHSVLSKLREQGSRGAGLGDDLLPTPPTTLSAVLDGSEEAGDD